MTDFRSLDLLLNSGPEILVSRASNQTRDGRNRIAMKSTACYVIFAVCISSAVAEFWTDCGSKLAKVESVAITGCDSSHTECTLKRNTNVTFNIDLTPNTAINKINTVVHGVMMGMPVPFPLPHPNACQGTGLECPLKANEKYSYTAVMPILKAYPKVAVDVKWELVNEKNEDLICLLIPAKIQ